MRRTRSIALFGATMTAVVALPLAGCSDEPSPQQGGETSPPSSSEAESPATDEDVALTFDSQLRNHEGNSPVTVVVRPVLRTPGGLLIRYEVTPERDTNATGGICEAQMAKTRCIAAVDPIGLKMSRVSKKDAMPSDAISTSRTVGQWKAGTTYQLASLVPDLPGRDTVTLTLGHLGVAPGIPVKDGTIPDGIVSDQEPDEQANPVVMPLHTDTSTGEVVQLVAPVGGGKLVDVTGSVSMPADVLFDFGKSNLTSKAASQIDETAKILTDQADPDKPVAIVGHTDSVGSKASNTKLSKDRAESVRQALSSKTSGLQLKASGRGQDEPVAPNTKNGKDNPAGRKLNRRVEISYTPKPEREAPPAGSAGGPANAEVPVTGQQQIDVTFPLGQKATATAYPVQRDGNLAIVRVKMNSDEDIFTTGGPMSTGSESRQDLSLLTITDPDGEGIYTPARELVDDRETGTLTADEGAIWATARPWGIQKDSDVIFWALTALPPTDTTTVTINVGELGEITDVPIQ